MAPPSLQPMNLYDGDRARRGRIGSIRNSETKTFRYNDENAPPRDLSIQKTYHHLHSNQKLPHKIFSSSTQILPLQLTQIQKFGLSNYSQDKLDSDSNSSLKIEARSVLATRTNSTANEITKEDDQLGDQIRELKEDLIRTKNGYFVKESLSQLRMSINKSLVMSYENEQDDDNGDDGNVMELNKHIDKFHTYSDDADDMRDSLQSSFASASSCEAESTSGDDEICSEDVEIHKVCSFLDSDPTNGILITLPHQIFVLKEPILS